MAGKPAEPSPSEQSPAGSSGDGGERARQRELVGPLLIERIAKTDGRALILYSQAPMRG